MPDHDIEEILLHNLPQSAKIYVAGDRGMVGQAMIRALRKRGYHHLLVRSHQELELTEQAAVYTFLQEERPELVILAAARVGGIQANRTYPAEFIQQNLSIELNVIHGAYLAGVQRLLFFGSSCSYPSSAQQPIAEEALLTGSLEPTSEPYAIAKIAGIKLCEAYHRQYGVQFRSVIPTGLYGPGDNFHPENSHVIPALMRKFHEAKLSGAQEVWVWGSGTPRREFLHVDDLAEAALFLALLPERSYAGQTSPLHTQMNIGVGEEVSIAELAHLMKEVTQFQGQVRFDPGKPDGAARKWLDSRRLASLGWSSRTGFRQGLVETYAWFLEHQEDFRA